MQEIQFLNIGSIITAAALLSACAQFGLVNDKNAEDIAYAPDLERSLEAKTSMSETGVAMNGYDPVHMLETGGETVVGDQNHAVQFLGCDQRMCFLPVARC